MLLENKIIRLGPHKNNKTNDQKIVLAEENFCVYDQDKYSAEPETSQIHWRLDSAISVLVISKIASNPW